MNQDCSGARGRHPSATAAIEATAGPNFRREYALRRCACQRRRRTGSEKACEAPGLLPPGPAARRLARTPNRLLAPALLEAFSRPFGSEKATSPAPHPCRARFRARNGLLAPDAGVDRRLGARRRARGSRHRGFERQSGVRRRSTPASEPGGPHDWEREGVYREPKGVLREPEGAYRESEGDTNTLIRP